MYTYTEMCERIITNILTMVIYRYGRLSHVICPCFVLFYIFKIQGRNIYIFKDFIYLFSERGEGRERETKSEEHQCVVASCAPSTGDLACNPGMCPDWESNWYPLVCRPALKPLSHTSQGKNI